LSSTGTEVAAAGRIAEMKSGNEELRWENKSEDNDALEYP
jgi:hypothetical protein